MPRALPASVDAVFHTLTSLHVAFTVSVLIYFVMGEIVKADAFDEPGGFINFGSPTIWALRGLFILVSLAGLVLSNTAFRDESFVVVRPGKDAEVNDMWVAAQLQSAHIVRIAYTEAIAIFGLDLFIFNGHRYDLYGFGLVALACLVLMRPSRDRWEATFRRFAMDHPTVSSSPWAPQS